MIPIHAKNGTEYLIEESKYKVRYKYTLYRKRGDEWHYVRKFRDRESIDFYINEIANMERKRR